MKRARAAAGSMACLGFLVAAGAWAYEATTVTNGGTIKGTVTFQGTPPARQKIPVTKDANVCGAEGGEKLSEALVVTGFPYDFKSRQNFARHLNEFMLSSRGVRRDGSAAIDMAYVACGRFDGFWEEGLNPWDMAAGVLLIEEAGGYVTTYNNGKFSIYQPPILASNGLIHSQMAEVLS